MQSKILIQVHDELIFEVASGELMELNMKLILKGIVKQDLMELKIVV